MTDLNDDLSDLLGAAATSPALEPVNRAPATFVPAVERTFSEPCDKCRGSGRFISYSGRDCGPCFTCKGSGKFTFKTAPETRAKARTAKAERKGRDLAAYVEANREVCEWLTRTADRNAQRGGSFMFPQAMLDAIAKYGSLTDRQLTVVREMMAKDATRATEREARKAAAPTVDASRIEQAFAKAREKADRKGAMGVWLKPLHLRSGAKDDPAAVDLTVSIATKHEGTLYVKQGETYLGKVQGGKFTRSFKCDDATEAAVLKVCSDPAQAAVAYGKAWSVCSVCHQTLTNDGSIERGIGPICATKYGF